MAADPQIRNGAVFEHHFRADGRSYHFDIAYPTERVAVELDGGTWSRSGRAQHITGRGYETMARKSNAAQLADWIILRFTPQMTAEAPSVVRQALDKRRIAAVGAK